MPDAVPIAPETHATLATVAREWTRLGCVGFGGPPAHVALLRVLCVDRRAWVSEAQFADAIAATQLLPGPASTQLAIWCAHRAGGGRRAAVVGGLGFVLPGLVLTILLATLFLAAAPPRWILGAGAGAGAAVGAVALDQGLLMARGTLTRAAGRAARGRFVAYAVAGAAAAALTGPWLVLVLLACGAVELALRSSARRSPGLTAIGGPHALVLATAAGTGGLGALAWVALKVGALAYGGGFVIIPLMQSDAVDRHHWMSGTQFLNAVALGQVTPGPVVHTVAAVGYAAAGVGGAVLAAAVAFSPSFAFVLLGADRFTALLADTRVRAFVDGAAPAALGAIAGSAVPLALALTHGWQVAILAAAAVALLALRRGVVEVLLASGMAGVVIVLAGAAV